MPKQTTPRAQDLAIGILNAPALEIPTHNIFIDPKNDLAFNHNDQSFYFYREGVWHILNGTNISIGPLARFIDKALDENFPELSITDARIKETATSLSRRIGIEISDLTPSPYIVFSNGTLDLNTLILEPHDRKHKARFSLPFDWPTTDQPHPIFDKYVERSFSDADSKLLIKQMIGYYLTPFGQEPAVFFIFGPQRTGKSTILEFLQDLFTPTFASSFALEELTTSDVYVAELAGKLVNIKDEDESERISGDKFKLLAGHGIIQARRLYQAPFSFKPYAKFLFSANELPNFKNIEGVTRRLHFLKFAIQVPTSEQDKDFKAKLMAEAPQIVRTCLLAFKQVLANNFEFVDPKTSQDSKDELILSAHPEQTFIREWTEPCLDPNSENWIANHVLYEHYKNFCHQRNHRPLNESNFHRRILQLPGIQGYISNSIRRKNLKMKHGPGAVPTLV